MPPSRFSTSVKKIQLFLIIVLTLLAGKSRSQSTAYYDIPALKKQLLSIDSDSLKTSIKHQLSLAYINKNLDSSNYWLNEATLKIDTSVKNYISAENYYVRGLIAREQSEYEAALKWLKKSLNHSPNIKNHQFGATLENIGNTYYYLGKLQMAASFYLEALIVFEQLEDDLSIAVCLTNISNVYYELGDTESDLRYNLMAEKLMRKSNNENGLASTLNNLGDLYKTLGELEKAKMYLLESIELKQKLNLEASLAYSLVTLGEIYAKMGKNEQGIVYCKKGLEIFEEFNNKSASAFAMYDLAEIYLKVEDLDKALSYALSAESTWESLKEKANLLNAYMLLNRIYVEKYDLPKAHNYLTKYYQIKDSIDVIQRHKTIYELQAKYESISKQNQIDLMARESELQGEALKNAKWLNIMGFITLFLMLIIIIIVVYMYVAKNKSNAILVENSRIIQEKNQEIKESNRLLSLKNKELNDIVVQLNKINKVVAHDLKTPLNHAMGMIELIEMSGALNSEQKEYISMLRRINKESTYLVEDLLYERKQLEIPLSNEKKNLNDIVRDRIQQFSKDAQLKNLVIRFDSEKTNRSTTLSLSDLNRILDNLISNAIKFSPLDKSIVVKTQFDSENFKIIVQDEGPGFTEKDKNTIYQSFSKLSANPTGNEKSTGLGLSIIKSIVTHLNGNIKLESEEGVGSKFTITLPYDNKA